MKRKRNEVSLVIVLLLVVLVFVVGFFIGDNLNGWAVRIGDWEGGDGTTSTLISTTSITNSAFNSGFEPSVMLSSPSINKNNQWQQTILGMDQSTGFSWSSDLPRPDLNQFSYIVNVDKNLDDYISTRIESKISHTGSQSNVLFQEVKRSDPDISGISRNEFLIYNDPIKDKLQQIYVRYWIKLQPDLNQLMPADGWRILMEWREQKNAARWTLEVRRDGSSNLYWRARGQKSPFKGDVGIRWAEENRVIAVPQGVWFPLEVFWKQSSEADGRFWVAVNGETIINYYGPNKMSGKIDYWSVFKVYTGKDFLARGTAYQWIDDVEINLEKPL